MRTAGISAALAVLVTACGPSDRRPEEAVQLFLKAVQAGKPEEIYELLTPENQNRLKKMAKMATAQTGGSQHFKPYQLIVAGHSTPAHRPGEISLIHEKENRARVKILSQDKKRHEILNLIRILGHWRIQLPERMEKESLGR